MQEFFHHFKLTHGRESYTCGIGSCTFTRPDFNQFKHHVYRVHSIQKFNANQLKFLVNQNSFFIQFLVEVNLESSFAPPDISFDMNSPLNQDIDNNSNVSNWTQDDFVFVKKLGKIAFKYNCALPPSMTNQFKYTSEYTKLLSTESPSPEVLNYTNEVFNNPNRVESYLVTNYSLFNYKIEKIDNDCSIFYTDPIEMVSGLLSNKFISEHLFFDTDKKRYLDSFMDGSKFRSSSGHTLHLLFYYDDFNPLLNCLS